MLDRRDVGNRVVVRRFVRNAQDGRPLFGDLLGELLEFGTDELVLRTRDGAVHRIRRQDVAAAKRIPPWRPANRAIRALERVAADGWPAPDTEPLGDWLLRAAEGFSNRANSALAVGDPGLRLPDAIAATAAWYQARRLVPRITTPLPLAASVADALAAAGWTAQPTVLVQTAPLAAIPAARDAIELATEPSADWLAIAAARKNGLPAAARFVLSAPAEVRFAAGYDQSALVAIARGVRTGEWLGISLVEVLPAARRRGLGHAVLRALADWAGRAGATRAYLQVEEANEAAVALYGRTGFTTHHRYVTWHAGPASGGPAVA